MVFLVRYDTLTLYTHSNNCTSLAKTENHRMDQEIEDEQLALAIAVSQRESAEVKRRRMRSLVVAAAIVGEWNFCVRAKGRISYRITIL